MLAINAKLNQEIFKAAPGDIQTFLGTFQQSQQQPNN